MNIANGYNECIEIRQVKLYQPIGFIPVEQTYQSPSFWRRLFFWRRRESIDFISLGIADIHVGPASISIPPEQQRSPQQPPSPREIIVGPSIVHSPNRKVQSKDVYREDFNLKAGWIGSLRPRPDTYVLSAEVTYLKGGDEYFRQIDVNVSIFPSLGSMLIGTLFGSILGTAVRALLKQPINMSNILDFSLIPQVFANLILGFVIGITLMRKKDVQPFLTIEDFWGGILLGFLVGYTGQQIFEQISNIQLGTSSTGTM